MSGLVNWMIRLVLAMVYLGGLALALPVTVGMSIYNAI